MPVDIRGFSTALAREIELARPNGQIVDEAAFESRHIVAPAWELARAHPEIRVFTHPGGRTTRCKPSCDAAVSEFIRRVEGCPRCWAGSKARTIADVFGMRNNFDLVAVDERGGSLAVEVKWLTLSATRGPNPEFQRFIGQCALAASANDVVIGVCGLRGRRKKALDRHEGDLKSRLEQIGVRLIVLREEGGDLNRAVAVPDGRVGKSTAHENGGV